MILSPLTVSQGSDCNKENVFLQGLCYFLLPIKPIVQYVSSEQLVNTEQNKWPFLLNKHIQSVTGNKNNWFYVRKICAGKGISPKMFSLTSTVREHNIRQAYYNNTYLTLRVADHLSQRKRRQNV